MDTIDTDIARWLTANGIDGDAGAAQAVFSALDAPGQYGAITTTRAGDETVLSGPAGRLTLMGAADIQTMRMRLEEIMVHPGQTTL